MANTVFESVIERRDPQFPFQQKGPRYWQENYLRSRTSTPVRLVYPYPQPLQSTPISNNMNQYANNGYICQQQQTFYYNYPMMNHSSTSGLTQVLATYAPGATILCMDSKEKQRLRLTPNVRSILVVVICLAILGGMTCALCSEGRSRVDEHQVPVMDRAKNLSFVKPLPLSNEKVIPTSNNREPLQNKSSTLFQTLERMPLESEMTLPLKQHYSRHHPLSPPIRIIYSFDDDDRDNEARVETLL